MEMPITGELVDEKFGTVVHRVEQLAAIQEHTRTVFALPSTLTRRDVQMIERVARLIAGDRVAVAEGLVKFTFTPSRPGRLPEYLANEFQLACNTERTTLRICGRDLDLGPSVTYIARCRLVGWNVLERDVPESGTTIEVKISPGESAQQFLGAIEHPGIASSTG
jgi:hypothetical protein